MTAIAHTGNGVAGAMAATTQFSSMPMVSTVTALQHGAAAGARPSDAQLVQFFHQMQLIRRFEERAAEQYTRRRIGGFLHLYVGEEAVATGTINRLRPDDYIVTHYRDHGHAIARGMDPNAVMAELFGRSTGVSRGKGGSMHLYDASRHFLGGYAIVAGHLPIACGLGMACQAEGDGRVCLCIFGDGAVNEGEFHEALNLASLWKLPVIFLCENNLYGMGTALAAASATSELYKFAEAYHIPGARCDGMDVRDCYRATGEALEHVRSGAGPYFLEAMTYRFRGHSMADPELYRSKEEVAQWRKKDPIATLREDLIARGVLSEQEAQQIERQVEDEVEAAVEFAEQSPNPDPRELFTDIYAESGRGHLARHTRSSAVGETTHADAGN
ncbi:MAG TPA: pyruvate dehydrogenase (acetyl-transferring) E1 component subunit alpha [Dehalococcoidia bacterium]|nr:pyruvate dehydrogenase (acetyl-transferring) E1 component subunit alpha [Dehalococcoidia bacterium]